MIIQGHPDILRGPQGLNGLHGFGSSIPGPVDSPAFTRFLPENGGKGIPALYQEITDFINTPGRTNAEIEQAKIASGVSDLDVENAFQFINTKFVDTKEDYTFEQFCPPGSKLVNGVCVGDSSTYSPDIFQPQVGPSAQEIRDFVSNNSQADILAAMARTGVTQSDIIRAFKEVDVALSTGQSPAFTRYLPENGGLGLEALYKEINDYASTHSLYELLAQMQRSGVSMKDVDAANSYAFGQQQSQAPAEYAAAQAAQAAAAAQAAQRAAAAAAAAAATKAQATAAAVVAPTKVFTPTGQSPAYTRFLPESGGKGITALYKEISDFVGTHSNAEIQTAMTASGVSEVDVINALQVFPNKPIVKTTSTVTTSTAGSGLTFPLILSAIAAYFLVG